MRRAVGSLFSLSLLSLLLPAQTPDNNDKVQTLEREVEAARHRLMDWAGLTRYGSEDTEIPPPKPDENRVVFLGDDITERWQGPFFPGKPYINRGIDRQTTPQMLVRFQQDVVNLHPKAVVIQGGSNDLAGFTGPATEVTIGENLISMVQISKANGIRIVLASATPVCDCYTNQTARRPQGKIIGLNGSIKHLAAASGVVYLDYYSALVNGRDFKKELTSDGLHPNEAGYRVMGSLAEDAIRKALAQEE